MMLDHLLNNERDKWKRDTFERIKKQLLSVRGNRFVQYNRAVQTHFVCVYGKSQVGKTTLILNMIGIKDEDSKKKVSEVLRGGVEKGNSSTSTAIIYSQSDSNKYGVSVETLNGQKSNDSIKYFTSDEMKRELQSIRDSVEKNQFSSAEIVHIFIPKDYFSESVADANISIMDLPGIESKNFKETAHVESLINRYIPISSVCIIATQANKIQSLEKEELPLNVDWRNLSHKFVVVTTNSYNDGSIKTFFNTPRVNRKESFQCFVIKRYKEELSKILGGSSTTRVFPLDMGESFGRLMTEELSNDKDCEEVRETRDYFLSKLQEFIINQKGEQLLSVIQELRSIVERTKNDRIQELTDKMKDENQELESHRTQLKNLEGELNEINGIEEYKEKIQALKGVKGKIDSLPDQVPEIMNGLFASVRQKIEDNNLSKNGYLKDDKKEVWNCIKINLRTLLENRVFSVINGLSLRNEHDIAFDLYIDTFLNKIIQDFSAKYKDKLYPEIGILDSIKNWVRSRGAVRLEEAFSYIRQLEAIIRSNLEKSIIEPINGGIDKKKKDISLELNTLKSLRDQKNNEIDKKREKIKEIETRLKEIDENIKIIEKQIEHDRETLETYLRFAEDAYLKQRDEIIKNINSISSPSEKFLYIMLLEIIEKDYKALKNISDE